MDRRRDAPLDRLDRLDRPDGLDRVEGPAERPSARAAWLGLLRRFGSDAVSFQGLEAEMTQWFEEGLEEGSPEPRGGVAFVDTGAAWVAAGGPVAAPGRLSQVAASFVRCAASRGRRACFFATERPDLEGFERLLIGEQPMWSPADWPLMVARHRRLREQIRRAASKGVRVRKLDPVEIAPGSALRGRLNSLAAQWLASRRLAPMAFLVSLDLYYVREEHRYFVAERGGDPVAFLSAVPVYARRGWLVEDLPRSSRAPNGTMEALIDALMRDVADSESVTLGLAPLAGPVSAWLRFARWAGRPLYDFQGLRDFKNRLRPDGWQSVWLVYPRAENAALHIVDSLRAFAKGSLVVFGAASIVRHPSGPPWALALPLVPWTALLAALVVAGRSDVLGFSPGALLAWVVFDALLIVQLLRSAARPSPARVACAAVPACVDAIASVHHVLVDGFGASIPRVILRGIATAAPCLGAAVLAWATVQAIARSTTVTPGVEERPRS